MINTSLSLNHRKSLLSSSLSVLGPRTCQFCWFSLFSGVEDAARTRFQGVRHGTSITARRHSRLEPGGCCRSDLAVNFTRNAAPALSSTVTRCFADYGSSSSNIGANTVSQRGNYVDDENSRRTSTILSKPREQARKRIPKAEVSKSKAEALKGPRKGTPRLPPSIRFADDVAKGTRVEASGKKQTAAQRLLSEGAQALSPGESKPVRKATSPAPVSKVLGDGLSPHSQESKHRVASKNTSPSSPTPTEGRPSRTLFRPSDPVVPRGEADYLLGNFRDQAKQADGSSQSRAAKLDKHAETGRRRPWGWDAEAGMGIDVQLLDIVAPLVARGGDSILGGDDNGPAVFPVPLQASHRDLVETLVAGVLTKRGMAHAAAAEVASRIDSRIDQMLADLKQADWVHYSTGQPLGDGLHAQIPDYMEGSGLGKIILYLHSLGMKPLSIANAVNKREVFFADLVAKVQFLQALGVRPRDMARVLARCPLLYEMPLEVLRSHAAFLLAVGVKGVDLGRVIELYPHILTPTVQMNIRPAMAYLSSLGMSEKGLARILRIFPNILGCRVRENILPTVEYLLSLGLSSAHIARAVSRCPQILGCSVGSNLQPTVEFLQCHLSDPADIVAVLASTPQVLFLNRDRNLGPTLHFFREELGMSSHQVAAMLRRNADVLSKSNEHGLRPKVEFFQSQGFSRNDIAQMIALFPTLLAYSLETLKAKYNYLVVDMGRPQEELLKFPLYFGYNLNNRIKARHVWLSERKILCSLNTMLSSKDQDFYARWEVKK